MKTKYYIAWWNVENLFDVYDSTEREAWLQRRLNSELKDWTEEVLQRKVDNLCSIIMQMNNNLGPDILGVCEVENRPVLDRLLAGLSGLGRDYDVVHHNTPDRRGIDVAFFYDKDKFVFEQSFSHNILKRTATRDLFQANFTTSTGKPLILIGNHWPARSAGVYESEPYRIIAAETLSYWMQRITEIRGKDIAVIAMGDFNDEPYNRSITDYSLSSNSRTNVVYARSPKMYNLMWPHLSKAGGTFYFNNIPMMIDQFMVSKEMVKTTGKFKVAKDDEGNYNVKVEMFDAMVSGGRYPNPVNYGRPAKRSSYNPDGFSDHYPISIVVGY
jgi:endonuclease/exonuclease/phosphatase family metal-dependent hydrolase